jgi:hypothetical protein
MVGFREESEAAVGHTFNEVDLPEWLCSIKLRCEYTAAETGELRGSSGCWKSGMAEVVGESEMGVINPDWSALSERDFGDALAIFRNKVKPRFNMRPQCIPLRRWALEHHARCNVHVGTAAL